MFVFFIEVLHFLRESRNESFNDSRTEHVAGYFKRGCMLPLAATERHEESIYFSAPEILLKRTKFRE
jgi:hypothetical protein